MGQAFTPGLIASDEVTIRKIRELPVKGETLVALGDRVSADSVVARAELPGDLHILRLPERMGLEPFEVLKGLAVKVGDSVTSGQLLCIHRALFGLLKNQYLSPCAGIVEFITERTGHVGVRGPSTPLELNSYLSGSVTHVSQGRSVTVEASAALVQGIFGVGGEKLGVLHLLDVSPSTKITTEMLPSSLQGKVIVGGMSPSLQVLKEAAARGAVGFVTGSIDDTALKGYLGFDVGVAITGDEDISMSVIVTEGFGEIPISRRVIALLEKYQGRKVSINGATQVRAGAVRPEIIIPHEEANAAVSSSALEARSLAIGSSIRVIRVPYFGRFATVTELPHELHEIETGAHARVLKAKLDDGQEVTVPRANVELV